MGTDYFRLHPWIGLLSNLPVAAGSAALLLLLWPPFRRGLERHPVLGLSLLFVLTRLVFLWLVVGVFGHVSLDLTTYFQSQGQAILDGRLPYRDFACSYAPLFPFLMALPVLTPWPTLAIFALFIACDLAALIAITLAAGLRETRRMPAAAWLYAAAPVTWYFLVRYGQDEALSAALLALAALAMAGRRETVAALLLGFGFGLTKFTFGIFIPPFWLAARHRGRFLLAVAGAAALVYGPALLAGLPVWRPLFGESAELGFGPSLWRLPVVFTPLRLGWPAGLLLLVALLAAWGWSAARKLRLESSLILTGCVFLLLSPKVLPMYITPAWPFVALWLAGDPRPRNLVPAALLNLLLGTWWYFDAGGIQGMFGPWVLAAAVIVTAAIPLLLVLLGLRASEPSKVIHFGHGHGP